MFYVGNIKEDLVFFVGFNRFFPVILFSGSSLIAFSHYVSGQEENTPVINVTGAEPDLQTNILSHLQVGREACDTPLQQL